MARKILLADDSVTAQNMGRKILADAGYEVIAVNNGSAALKKIAELKPDLVVLDVYMPGYSGLEVCQRLKENPETARIPVLLTVGKLEPFKPEEAQRVRAEGFIVKPFEASELLSALSKLEDKVVPRAEPSKPGRFARAMAAADAQDTDQDNGRNNERSKSETGWKNRIAFPQKKSEAEQAQDAAAERETEKISAKNKSSNNKDKRSHSLAASGESVDISAFAPIGIPKDVTPSEVAAITAAAAQMQMAETTARDEQKASAPESATTGEFSVEPAPEKFQDSRADENQTNSNADAHQPEPEVRSPEPQLPEPKLEDAPVTMAAASETAADANSGTPRWTAVPVALGSDETAMSLDHEMQKAYAAFAAADYATSAGSAPAESAADDSSSPSSFTSFTSDTKPVPVSESHVEAISEAALPPLEATTQIAQVPDSIANENSSSFTKPASAASQFAESAVETASAPAYKNDPPAVEYANSTPASATIDSSSDAPKFDSETVKTTAAAWASWRQIRDTQTEAKSEKKTEAERPAPSSQLPSEPPVPEPVSSRIPQQDTAALAVAAGAEQSIQEAASPANGNPTDVASIVDSVLAGLRPKLMEEITRKMAEKK